MGGVNHQETLTKSDDFWGNASIGPAADGRVKPDLCHFYDTIFTTDDTVSGYIQFCCTSGATPIVAGHFGLFFQMWSEGIFGNDADPEATVFENRPHSTTAKAVMINTADSYPFSGANANLTRTHQGWGMPDLENLYELRNNMFIVDEEIVLSNLESVDFEMNVVPGQDSFRATMVYLDPMGTTSSSQHRINDLSLRVIAPDGTTYWGNNGLGTGNTSSSGGAPNTIDTVENVFVDSPQPGAWTVTVIAFEINEDSHVETAEVDADFALVVSGVSETTNSVPYAYAIDNGVETGGNVGDLGESDDQYLLFQPARPQGGQAPVSVIVFTEIANPATDFLSLQVESSTDTPGLNSRIEVFNFVSNEFEVLDNRAAAFDDDETVKVTMPGIASQYIDPSTGNAITRLTWRNAGPNLRSPWNVAIDNVVWSFE